MCADPRSPLWHRRETERRLAEDVDVWVAGVSADGAPYLVPLSFDWDGRALLMATRPTAPPVGTWPPPGPFGSGWVAPGT